MWRNSNRNMDSHFIVCIQCNSECKLYSDGTANGKYNMSIQYNNHIVSDTVGSKYSIYQLACNSKCKWRMQWSIK